MNTLVPAACIALSLSLSACTQPNASAEVPVGLIEGIAKGSTQVIDLTHVLNSKTPYWPGKENRPFRHEYFTSLEKDGFLEGRFSVDEHTGTHFDAPNHFVKNQSSVDAIPVKDFIVPLAVIDLKGAVAGNPDYLVSREDVLNWEKANGKLAPNSVVVLRSGWESRWTKFDDFKNSDAKGVLHFPGFSSEAASLLVKERGVAGLGTDALSVDAGASTDFPAHVITHGVGKYNLENIGNLDSVPAKGGYLVVAPMKIEGGTGSPVRLLALVPNSSK